MKRIIIAIISCMFLTISCIPLFSGKGGKETVEVTSVSLSKTELTLEEGESEALSATVSPSTATDKTVEWSSSAADVVEVSKDGVVKALKVGTAMVTAKSGPKSATCQVNVVKPAIVTTGEAETPSPMYAVVSFTVNFAKAGSYTSFDAGICYSKTETIPTVDKCESATIEKDKEGNPDKSGSYKLTLNSLSENTTYYYCAWAKFDSKVEYGVVKSFKTPAIDMPKEQMVDLGLSVKWAGWNIGATKPEEFGGYYAWGEIKTKERYAWDTYQWGIYDSFKKYCTNAKKGEMDERSTLTPSDDVATVEWGGKWRMPTMDEKIELLAQTDHQPYTVNGVAGYLFTSKKNGKSIFIPSAGLMANGKVEGAGEICGFWTSTLNPNDNNWSYAASNKTDDSLLGNAGFEEWMTPSWYVSRMRFVGSSIRAVNGDNKATYTPVVAFSEIKDVLPYEASFEAAIEDLAASGKSASNVSEFGICMSTSSSTPSVSDQKFAASGSLPADGKFSVKATSLPAETMFYCRAYAVIDGTAIYSSPKQFTTLGDIAKIDPSAKYVDLGLSVKWANWNLGASKPEEFGGYYAWAETTPKTTFSLDNYKYYSKETGKYTKYCSASALGAQDGFTSIRPIDDAAFMTLGENYQMPSSAQWDELVEKCSWKYTIYNGVRGFVVKGTNGNAVFFPMSGVSEESGAKYVGKDGYYRGYYWSGNLDLTQGSKTIIGIAYCINNENIKIKYSYNRKYGLTIRPVWGNSPLSSKVDGVEFVESSYKVKVGETVQTSIRFKPIDPLNTNVTYTSGNPTVATVDEKGVVKGIGTGEALIQVKTEDGGFTASVKVGVVKNITLENGAIDLGLSVLWSSTNVGGTKPEDYGDYFMWACTDRTKSGNANHPLWDPNTARMVRYNFVDNLTTLKPEDDAATVNMGSEWRTPSEAQCQELIDKCSWEKGEYEGINGYFVTGPSGKTIFLPFAGADVTSNVGKSGAYQTANAPTNNGTGKEYHYCTYLEVGSTIKIGYFASRYNRMTIRAVKSK